jgi:hypothetical protein
VGILRRFFHFARSFTAGWMRHADARCLESADDPVFIWASVDSITHVEP